MRVDFHRAPVGCCGIILEFHFDKRPPFFMDTKSIRKNILEP